MNHRSFLRSALALVAVFFAPIVGAQSVYPPDPALVNTGLDTISPYRGTYYDPTQPGTGIQVDVSASGNAFVTYYSYNVDGSTSWYIVQGTYQPSSELARWTTGVIGTLSGPFYQAHDGQCLGCAFKPTSGTVATGQTANFTWVTSSEVKMTVGSQSWDFIAPNLDGKPDGDTLIGAWTVHVLQNYNGKYGGSNLNGTGGIIPHDALGAIYIAKQSSTNQFQLSSAASPGLTPITPAAAIYSWSCAEYPHGPINCDQSMGVLGLSYQSTYQGSRLVFWYDPSIRKLGADVVFNGGTIGPENVHLDLYAMTPNVIIGRGIVEGTDASHPGPFGVYLPGALNVEVILQRIPNGATAFDTPNSF